MSHDQKALGFHMRELAEHLELNSFRALSQGWGLGRLKPSDSKGAPLAQVVQGVVNPVAAQSRPPLSRAERIVPPRQDRIQAPAHLQPWRKILGRIYAGAIDLSLVVLSIALAIACAAAFLSIGQGTESFWYEGGPLSWLLKLEIVEIVSGILGVFLLYLGTFRFLVGKTFGESLVSLPVSTKPKSYARMSK